jgi:hypothetical protein
VTDRGIMAAAATATLFFLVTSASLAGFVQTQRDELDLVITTQGVTGMPPHVAVVTAALGTFRGLAVDLLWARADKLEMEGEFYEAQTLAEWITTLQPRFQKVWGFQAWNLAWNISAATQVPAERWGWVRRGIELLRAKGIPLNPKAAILYTDLAWIFQNKIGRESDKEHWYYKARLAEEMQELLGDLVGGRSTTEVIARFRKISDAPSSLDELINKVPAVQSCLDVLARHGMQPDRHFLRMLGRVMMQFGSLDAQILGDTPLPQGVNGDLLSAVSNDRETAHNVFEHLVPFLQRQVLENEYSMNVGEMQALMEQYGPLDWRHPEAHGMYWAELGVKVARDSKQRQELNELMLVRNRLLMLMNLIRSGRVDFDPVTDRIDFLPDPRFTRIFERAIVEAFELIESEQGVAAAEFGLAEEADLFTEYENFLNIATMLCYLHGSEDEAERYFLLLRDVATKIGAGDEPAFSGTLENFIAIRFAKTAEVRLGDLRQLLDAMMRRAFLSGLAAGDLKAFTRYMQIAKGVYENRYGAVERGEDFMLSQSQLLPFPELVVNAFQGVMKQESVPVLTRARIWHWSPEKLRNESYKNIAEVLARDASKAGLDPARAFPPPAEGQVNSVVNE